MTEMALRPPTWRIPAAGTTTLLDIVVPVFDEEAGLETCIRRLHAYLREQVPYDFRITVADNASTDATLVIAERLARELDQVTVVHLPEKGRGRALRQVWSASDAKVLAYMDVDLSTDLAALLPLVAPLVTGHSDIAIGTRLSRGARVVRGPRRELISRSYNLILRGALQTHFSDAQCGFKAVTREVAQRLLPLVEDTGWFFDTELLVLAERAGLRIHEVPVDWVDDPDSRVAIVPTALADLKGVWRVGRALADGTLPIGTLRAQLGREPLDVPGVPRGLLRQSARFAVVGVSCTLAYLGLYVALAAVLSGQVANLLALLITAVANTAANRRWTFGVRGALGAGRHQLQGLLVFGLGLALTSTSLLALHVNAPRAGRTAEVAVLVTANLVATALRFVLFRAWVFRPGHATTPETSR
jgi:putative flippase GtrA